MREEPRETSDGILGLTIPGLNPGMNFSNGNPLDSSLHGKAYGSMFWAGLPLSISAFDPGISNWILNYGYVEEMGRYDIIKRGNPGRYCRGSTQRQGWLAKALC